MTNGHVKHIEAARAQTGCDTVLCVMSGSFVQRGDAAVADKYIRAQWAVMYGADAVVELPAIYAISPADNFAFGAIKSISAFSNVEYISFGSECGDVELLTKVAYLLEHEPKELSLLIQRNIKEGYSFPKARAMAVEEFVATDTNFSDIKGILDQPNNVLGVAYIAAAMRAKMQVKFHTIKRLGAGHNDHGADSDKDFISSSAIRLAARRGELGGIQNKVPKDVYNYLLNMRRSDTSLSDMVLGKLKSMSGHDLQNYYDVTGGIHNRLMLAAKTATTIDELLENAKTKNYTMARLKRLCLYAYFDITQEMYNEAVTLPTYVQVLALNAARKDILSALSESCKNVLTRYSDVNRVDKSLRHLIKLDFITQGTLDIINRSNYYIKKMLLIEK
jgi:predicted nucleotidyltransferase